MDSYNTECIRLRGDVDRLRAEVENLKLALAASELEPQRQVRRFQYAQDQAAAKLQAASEAQERMRKEYMLQIKEQRAAHAFEVNQLLGEQRGERAQAMETTTRLEGLITDLEKQLRSAHAAMRKGGQMAAKTQEQLEGELQRVKEGRVWSAVHEEQATRVRVEAQRDELKAEVVRLNEQVNSRSRKHAANMDELYTLRGEVKSLQKLNAVYDVKAQRKFFEVDPILEQKADLKRQVESLRQQLKAEQEQTAKYKAIAEPPKEKFFVAGHYTADVDLSALEMIASLGVSPNVAPALFVNFADFYGIKLPSREKKVCTGTDPATGERVYEVKDVLFIPGKTHMKELPAIGGELHKMQVAEWLLDDPEANYCYVADGANSQQKEILAQLLYRRNKETGKLESMAMSIDEIPDKTSVGQYAKFTTTLEAIAKAWDEAAELGLLDDGWQPATAEGAEGAEGEQTAAHFHEQRRKALRKALRAKISELKASSTMNDRAAPARKAGRLSRGGDGSGGDGDVADDPTCAHHAVANIGEEGRKAIDAILKRLMNISAEQSEGDSAKVKALRTQVGWFSSPACSLIYQVSKYVALFSSKGYAIGANFAQWLAHKLKTTEQLAAELIGHVQDLLAICGGRDYVFFLDAAVVDRLSQLESLYGYLLEEADLGAEAGGKLRKAILTGFESVYCMSAVRSMSMIADAWLWPMLRAIEPGDDVHILDVCPALWPRSCTWLEEAAANPQSAIDGTLSLRTSLEAAGLRTTPRRAPTANGKRRAERAAIDLQRTCNAINKDAELKALVHEMLSAAFTAMADGIRNHAAEFMPGGGFCTANLTAELRKRLDGMPLTSVGAETMFARSA